MIVNKTQANYTFIVPKKYKLGFIEVSVVNMSKLMSLSVKQ